MFFDVTIIGAGLVGLATGHRLLEARPGLKLAFVEKEDREARHQSSHNSGVIHSGIYYRPGSLKARNCIRGYGMLLEFCRRHEVAHEVCGKIIVATQPAERPRLEDILRRGEANGLQGLRKLNAGQIRELEPHVRGVEAIHVPQAGIVDFPAVAHTLRRLIEQRDGRFFFGQAAREIAQSEGEALVRTPQEEIRSRLVINCGGLYADKLAERSGQKLDVMVIPFRGEYYKLKPERRHLVRNLIYPVPDPAFPFLGVHFTRMIDGEVEAGPNAVLAFRREGYRLKDFDFGEFWEILAFPGFRKLARRYWQVELDELHRSFSKRAFVRSLQRLIPEVGPEDFLPGGSGVRAQAVDRAGNLVDDFLILENHRVLNVVNAPSPAATSCLSIGQSITDKVLKILN
ncbi:MAG: L-2-hydroxyglutarate oxidase [Bacteroidetes bacterium]|nr:MAG: L-2-hydroxyglutarate oxidase [Bacteroidota bacterium]